MSETKSLQITQILFDVFEEKKDLAQIYETLEWITN